MKNRFYENLGRQMREYHRSHPWRLSGAGLYIPHSYDNMMPDNLSYWDDVGFILNGRRFMVWWQHPRNVYANAIQEQAWNEVGRGPQDHWLFEGVTKNYRQVGKSGKRKKLASYTVRQPSEAQSLHYAKLQATEDRLSREGIDLTVQPSWEWERMNWAMGISLVAPFEVRNTQDLAKVAQLARQLVLWKTTLAEQFPDHSYGRADWLRDHARPDS